MNIGWHAWEPGLANNRLTAAGGGAWIRQLFAAFRKGGHAIHWLPSTTDLPDDTERPTAELPDVTFFCWRWEMPHYPERQAAYESQTGWLRNLMDAKKRVVVFDMDHKILVKDVEWLRNGFGSNVIFAAPELFPKAGFKQLHFPSPHDGRFRPSRSRKAMTGEWSLMYIGNNYERSEQAAHYVNPLSMEFRVVFFGNWVDNGFGRESANEIRMRMPRVHFFDRVDSTKLVHKLATADTTVHLFKPSYGPVGFTTFRWAEAAMAGTPAFVPAEFALPPGWRSAFGPFVVRDGEELARQYANIHEWEWQQAIAAQVEFMNQKMRVAPWITLATNWE